MTLGYLQWLYAGICHVRHLVLYLQVTSRTTFGYLQVSVKYDILIFTGNYHV